MKKLKDKNGNPLKGAAIWTKTISLDGGLESHDKKVAMKAYSDYWDFQHAEKEAAERRKQFKVV